MTKTLCKWSGGWLHGWMKATWWHYAYFTEWMQWPSGGKDTNHQMHR